MVAGQGWPPIRRGRCGARFLPSIEGGIPMQCPSCEHEAAQASFGDPLRCPECGAFYEKAVALRLQKELAGQRAQLARDTVKPPVAPAPAPKKKTSWVAWGFGGLFVAGMFNVILNAPTTPGPAPVLDAPTARVPAAAVAAPIEEHDPIESALASVKLDYKWGKKHDTLMIANFTVINDGYEDVKDIEIECIHAGPSGTRIDSNKRTIYEVVPARSRKSFSGFDMGFIHSQAVKSVCTISSLKV